MKLLYEARGFGMNPLVYYIGKIVGMNIATSFL